MIKNSSVSRCLKSDFKVIEKIHENLYIIRWGYKEEKGEDEYIGGTNGTNWCSYEGGQYKGILNRHEISKHFRICQRIPSMAEMKIIGEALKMTEEQMVPWMKEPLKRAINKYDKSRGADGVENFTINGINVWLEKEERVGLLLRFQAEKAEGKTETTLWRNGIAFPLVIDSGIQMLYALEVYASATYDLKEQLLAEVDKLDSVAGMIAFDETRKNGYPAQLAF